MTIDEAALRQALVGKLIQQGCIRSEPVREAFFNVPRHVFVPGVPLETAYSEEAIVTRRGTDGLPSSSSSMPAIMAVMIEQLDVHPRQRVLEIGEGTGYNAAILARLVGPEGQVTTVDIDEDIVQDANENLLRAGYPQVHGVAGDGWLGVREDAPFDRIEVTVGLWDLSPYWVEQLREGGTMVVPLWLRAGVQASIAFRKDNNSLTSVSVEPCGFMRLRGPHRGPESYVTLETWEAGLDHAEPSSLDVLRELLQENPRSEPAPDLPKGWAVRLWLALSEPKAITMVDRENWRRGAWGVFDPESKSLALIVDDVLQTYGSESARATFLKRVKGAEPQDIRKLSVRAHPSSVTTQPHGAGWVFVRPNFTFVVDDGTGDANLTPGLVAGVDGIVAL